MGAAKVRAILLPSVKYSIISSSFLDKWIFVSRLIKDPTLAPTVTTCRTDLHLPDLLNHFQSLLLQLLLSFASTHRAQ